MLLILATQVTTLVSSKSPQKKKGKSKRAHVLVAAVERATAIFVERGELIAVENPDIKVMKRVFRLQNQQFVMNKTYTG